MTAEQKNARQETEVEPYLNVGTPLVFQSDPAHKESPRYPTVLRGWRKPSYMLLDRPKVSGHFAAMRDNQPCVMRFVHEGRACAFDSVVLDWDTRQYNSYCRILWPRSVTVVSFRKAERVRATIPCKVHSPAGDEEGFIRDMSLGGCGVEIKQQLPVNLPLSLSFSLTEGIESDNVKVIARSIRQSDDGYLLGCQFVAGQTVVENDVAFYVMSSLNRSGRGDTGMRAILINKNPEEVQAIKSLLEQQGHESTVFPGALDALAYLRMSPISAVLLSQQQTELPGILIARLIRTSAGFENTPIFLMHADDAATVEQAAKIGVTQCFASNAPSIEILSTMVRAISATPPRQ